MKFYQASTSELFGKVQEIPQTEKTPFYPRSPYGVAKLYAYWIIVNYREAYNIFACNGILFNHESPRRGETFVTRKITRAVSRIVAGLQENLSVGNLHSKRDWGYAPEYCEGMWQILQHNTPEDFVLATNETHSVREFCEVAFNELGIEIEWRGKGENEIGVIKKINLDTAAQLIKDSNNKNNFKYKITDKLKEGDTVVTVNPRYYRPTEVDLLIGNPAKAQELLGWKTQTGFKELVKLMTKADFEKVLIRGF